MNNDKKYNKRALTINEAAKYACVSRGMIENWLSRGLLPFEELPSRGRGSYCFRRIRKNDLDDFLNRYHQQNSQPINSKNKKELKEMILLPQNS